MSKYSHYLFLIIVTMMMSVNLFATDVYLPALPEMALYYKCSQTDIQFSFTVFLLGLAACQLVSGRLSDYFGRRKVAIVGFSIFTIFSFLCGYATSLEQLNLFRLIQAIGGGVGSVIGRALIVDNYNRQESVKIFSSIYPIVGLSTAIGPPIGGFLTTHFGGWQATFIFIGMFGLAILALTIAFLGRGKTRAAPAEPVNETSSGWSLQSYFSVMGNLEFLGYALMICASFCIFRSYSVESPFVFDNQGYGAESIGKAFIWLSIAYLIGNLTAKKLVNHFTLNKVLRLGFLFLLLGGCSMIVAATIFTKSPYALIIPMSVISFGNGFLFPIASAGALKSVPSGLTGTASGLMGAMQFLLAAACSHWIGEMCHGRAVPVAFFISGLIILGIFSFLLMVNKNRVEVTTL